MKWIIAGGRDLKMDYRDYLWLKRWLHIEVAKNGMPVIITGGARGIDWHAREWAALKNLESIEVKAEWKKFGKKAGPMRNRTMAMMADGLIAFEGGKGTANMIKTAMEHGLKIIYRAHQDDT